MNNEAKEKEQRSGACRKDWIDIPIRVPRFLSLRASEWSFSKLCFWHRGLFLFCLQINTGIGNMLWAKREGQKNLRVELWNLVLNAGKSWPQLVSTQPVNTVPALKGWSHCTQYPPNEEQISPPHNLGWTVFLFTLRAAEECSENICQSYSANTAFSHSRWQISGSFCSHHDLSVSIQDGPLHRGSKKFTWSVPRRRKLGGPWAELLAWW